MECDQIIFICLQLLNRGTIVQSVATFNHGKLVDVLDQLPVTYSLNVQYAIAD